MRPGLQVYRRKSVKSLAVNFSRPSDRYGFNASFTESNSRQLKAPRYGIHRLRENLRLIFFFFYLSAAISVETLAPRSIASCLQIIII